VSAVAASGREWSSFLRNLFLYTRRRNICFIDSCQNVGLCLRELQCIMYRLCPSVCLLFCLGLHPKIKRASAQGINQRASGAAALSGRDQDSKMLHNW